MLPISGVAPVSSVALSKPVTPSTGSGAHQNFGHLVATAVNHLETSQNNAQNVLAQAIAGHGSVTNAMTAVSQSQSAVDVATAIRNASVQTVQSFMNLQI